ncbi:Methyltransferase type 11 [Solidesulfovibrio fructosivorans JJ]]|uniref:Methyltransferase type 11 n=1 Tax=Solidesulfovibrio fructosivorans JJ] TaxID=596151 RepID=E1JUY5_SOLFR|nr:methyltransferase domain-containing protein [Solidesulfovibrio fructosivorans]EFL51899.1 Methyltransferase type 11 [Solidesulfovibrio fructosivorans JJ]]
MTAQIRGHFDRAGATYEAAARVQRLVAARLAALCPPVLSGRVLEIGAGSGLLTRNLTPRLAPGAAYAALDISPGMLTHAAMPGAQRLAADGERPPFLPGTFDFLASASAMHWYADPARSIAANLRLLRPGGGFAIALYVQGTLGELEEASRATGFGSVYPMRPAAYYKTLFTDLTGGLAEFEEKRHAVTYDSVGELLRALKGAGVTHTPGTKAGSPARYREFVRYYENRFGGDAGIRATYATLYVRGRRALGAS